MRQHRGKIIANDPKNETQAHIGNNTATVIENDLAENCFAFGFQNRACDRTTHKGTMQGGKKAEREYGHKTDQVYGLDSC